MANIWSDSLSRSVVTDDRVEFSAAVKTAQWFEMYERAAAPTAHTLYGQFYVKSGDHKPYFQTSTGVEMNVGMIGGNPLVYKGGIAAAANFPTVAAVQGGWTYSVTADVTDNDPTKTNTGQSFLSGSTIAWDGAAWIDIGEELSATWAAATPVAVGAGDRLILVDTVTIAGPAVVNLPAATATNLGKTVVVVDATGAATAVAPIAITPNGANTIDGVAAAINITGAFRTYAVTCVQVAAGPAAYGWTSAEGLELRTATARLAAIGAGRSHADSRQLAAATETLRVFRALAPGRIVACAAETGTAAAAGESMTFDVQIAGVSALTGVITIDSAVAIDTPVAGVVGAGAVAEFAAGELITVVRTYVAGGGPTPMRDTVVDIDVRLD